MGGCHLNQWLQAPVPTAAPPLTPGQNDCHHRPGEISGTRPGAFCPPGQGGNRVCRSSAATQRLLLNILPCGQEDRWFSPHFRSKGTESVPEGPSLPHAHHNRGPSDHCGGRLVYINRSDRRLLSRAYCGRTSQFSQVRLSGAPLAIPGAPIRALPFPEGVYSMRESSPLSSTGLRSQDSAIPGRLASLCSLSGSCLSGYVPASTSCVTVRPQSQLGKELSGSISDNHLSWDASGLRYHDGPSICSQGGRHTPACPSIQTGQGVSLHNLPANAGQTDISHSCRALRAAPSASFAAMAQQLSPRRQAAQASQADGDQELPPCPSSLARGDPFVQWCSNGASSVSKGGGHHGCQPHGLGCRVATQSCSGSLGPKGAHRTHKCAGAAGCAHGPPVPFAPPRGKACADSDGQHLCCISYKPPRGHQVSASLEGVKGSPGMGVSPSVYPACSVSARTAEPGCGLSIPPGTCSGRVVSSPRRSAHNLEPLWAGRGRSVRHRGVDPLPPMVFPNRGGGRTGPGRTGSSMAAGSPVCLSTPLTDLADSTEGSRAGPQSVAGSSVLASAAVVPAALESVSRYSMASSSKEGSAVSVGGTDMAPQPSTSPAVGMAPGRLTGCSDTVRHTILSARASSTRLQYANRWRLFSQWCSAHNENPVSCSVPTILEFLQSLLDKGRSPSTLKVYVAAISCLHQSVDNRTVGRHELVSLFLRGARRLCQRPAPRAPDWDLPLVLTALCHPPFEPLAQAELKWLSCKTAFLMAIVSAKRVSELHALSVSPRCIRWNPDGSGVTLWPNTAFVPKVLSPFHRSQPLRLARFQPQSGTTENESELLCPVRALEAYIAATANLRRSDQLFLCYGGPRLGCPLSKQRLSHWIVSVICHAYAAGHCSLPVGVRAHSTRSVTASWAALRGVPLEAICAAASWASPTTFTRFYSVNVAAPHPMGQVLLQGSAGPPL